MVNSREMLEYPARVSASSVSLEQSVSVSSPPVMGRRPRLLASLANSSAPHRLVSVRASAGYPCSFARASSSWVWDAPFPEGVEALNVKLDVSTRHRSLCRCRRSSLRSWNRAIRLPSPRSIRWYDRVTGTGSHDRDRTSTGRRFGLRAPSECPSRTDAGSPSIPSFTPRAEGK